MNKRESVNTSSKGLSLERALLDSVRRLFADIDWLHTESSASLLRAPGDHGADAVVQIGTAGKFRARIYAHAKSDVRPGAFPAWARQRLPPPSKEPAVSVLATPFVSPRLADLCRQEGWGWIDLAGNCRIDLPGLLRNRACRDPTLSRAANSRGKSRDHGGREGGARSPEPRSRR